MLIYWGLEVVEEEEKESLMKVSAIEVEDILKWRRKAQLQK